MEFDEAQELCICPDCPTYVACGEPLAFCLNPSSTSKCIKDENGCICPSCPVSAAAGLHFDFYCTRGNEKAQAQ